MVYKFIGNHSNLFKVTLVTIIMEGEQNQKSEWNIDDAVLKEIYSLKINFINQISNWSLEGAYWTLTSIDAEISPAMKDDEQNILKDLLKELEEKRIKLKDKKKEGEFYVLLIKTYKTMNQQMIDSGWYFRRKELYGGL
jgi:hypothetical protein